MDIDRIQKYFIAIAWIVIAQFSFINMVTGEVKNPPRTLSFYTAVQSVDQQLYK